MSKGQNTETRRQKVECRRLKTEDRQQKTKQNERGNEKRKLRDRDIRKILRTSPECTLDELLKEMRETQIHFALVTDAKKGLQGIATLEDVLEAIVGDIIDESDILTDSQSP